MHLLPVLKHIGEWVQEQWPGTAQTRLINSNCRCIDSCPVVHVAVEFGSVVANAHCQLMSLKWTTYHKCTRLELLLPAPLKPSDDTNSIIMAVTSYCLVLCIEKSDISAHLCLSVIVH